MTPDEPEIDEDDDPAADVPGAGESEPATENVAEPKAVKKRTRKIDRERENATRARREFWSQVFALKQGRAEMYAILQKAQIFDGLLAGITPAGFPDHDATLYNTGRQQFGMAIYSEWMKLDPEGVLLMLRENDARFRSDENPNR